MKMENTIRLIIICLIFSISVSAQHKIPQSVIGNGGAVVTNSNHRINGTVGQNFIGVTKNTSFSNSAGFWYFTGRILTIVEQLSNTLPFEYRMEQNYPNPFNPSTTIIFELPAYSYVSLKIYNLLGQEVTTLIDQDLMAGQHFVSWDAYNFASGVYFYRLYAHPINVKQLSDFILTKKLLLLK